MSAPRHEPIESYSGLFNTTADVYRPKNEQELQSAFATATRDERRVTIRCGGHAFHDQSLGDQMVISMEHFRKITIGPGPQVTVGAGARWGTVVRRLKRKGFAPYGTVTSSRATPGGTLAADCLNRFSPSFGKEAEHVRCFRMMTIDGSCKYYYPPRDPNAPPATWSEDERIFMAVVGGFGYLGALLEITYAVRPCGSRRLAVRTEVEKLDSFKNLATSLVPPPKAAWGTARGANATCDGDDWEAISAGLYPAGGNEPSAIIFKSKLVKTCKRRPYLLHHPYNPLVIVAQLIMRQPQLCRWLSRLFYRMTTNGATYTDGLFGYLFMMDANWIARDLARRVGIDLRTVQQTFVVPAPYLVPWLELAHNELTATRHLTPTITDVLYLPGDLTFCLSPNARTPGFAVSYAFETNTTAPVIAAFEYLAEILSKPPFSAHVSLVKNVCADESTLQAMYGAQAVEFVALKNRLDPQGLIRNAFLDRILP